MKSYFPTEIFFKDEKWGEKGRVHTKTTLYYDKMEMAAL